MSRHSKKIEQLKRKMNKLGPFIPGSLSTQWNVCSTAGCKCKDKKKPKRHGPYYQVSFTIKGRSSTLFVKKEDVPEVRRRIRRYKVFKQLCTELTQAYVDHARHGGFKDERNKDE